jgi:hypothetical protein
MKSTRRILPLMAGFLLIAGGAAADTASPTLTSLNPRSAPARSAGFTLTFSGTNFVTGCYLSWGGQLLPATLHSGTEGVVSIKTSMLAAEGTVRVVAFNSDGSFSNALDFEITAPSIGIATSALPQAAVGVAYSSKLAAYGGTPPYTWSALSGLPPGLNLQPDGTLSGTPAAAGNYSISVRVSDSAKAAATGVLSLTVASGSGMVISTATLPAAVLGQSYNLRLEVSGGTAPYRWAVSQLPAGLQFDATQGIIAGTPSTAGTFRFAVQVSDSTSLTATREFSLTVNSGPLTITTVAPLFTGTVGTQYAQVFSASGGTTPYT